MADRALAAASLLRAFMLDDAETGVLILRQNGSAGDVQALKELTLAVTALASRTLLSANGSDVARALGVVDTWIDGYATQTSEAPPVSADRYESACISWVDQRPAALPDGGQEETQALLLLAARIDFAIRRDGELTPDEQLARTLATPWMWRRHDSLYVAAGRFRPRLGKPWRPR